MRKTSRQILLFIAIGALLIAYLLHTFYRNDSDALYWPDGGIYIDPYSTINNPNNV